MVIPKSRRGYCLQCRSHVTSMSLYCPHGLRPGVQLVAHRACIEDMTWLTHASPWQGTDNRKQVVVAMLLPCPCNCMANAHKPDDTCTAIAWHYVAMCLSCACHGTAHARHRVATAWQYHGNEWPCYCRAVTWHVSTYAWH